MAYYPFDGNANDYSGNGYNATAQNVTTEPGVLGQAYLFNGSTSSVVVSSGTTSPATTRTFCAWISPAAGATSLIGSPIILSGTSITNPSQSFDQFSVNVSGADLAGGCRTSRSALFIDHYGASCYTASTAITNAGQWNFVCYETDGTQMEFSVNGTSFVSSGASVFQWEIPKIAIGTNTAGAATTGAAFDGGIDEVSLWSVVLSPGQIGALYNGGTGCRAHQ